MLLARLLADGEVHRVEAVRAALNEPNEIAIERAFRELEAWGLDPRREHGGYRLGAPPDLLDDRTIRAGLAPSTVARVRRLEVHGELGSTNDVLLAVDDLPAGQSDLMLAEFQSAGRGRQGRPWLAPFASGICLSLSWRFPAARADVAALGPAVGVAIMRALRGLGLSGIGLKWPNDLLVAGDKLAGVLCELRTASAAGAYVVIGVGLNHRLPAATREALRSAGRAATDLTQLAAPAAAPRRDAVVVALADAIVSAMVQYAARGFAAFGDEWAAADVLAGRTVTVHRAGSTETGLARGIASDGTFRVQLPRGLVRLNAGEVSLRAAP